MEEKKERALIIGEDQAKLIINNLQILISMISKMPMMELQSDENIEGKGQAEEAEPISHEKED